ncbi:MAG: cupin domain-containing protein [Agathobacter sp.]
MNEKTGRELVTNVARQAMQNTDFRSTLWTGSFGQMTLMSIPVCSDIGLEIHKDTDQIIRIEQGNALAEMGDCKDHLDYRVRVCTGDLIFVPAGTWHNVTNIGRIPLKLSTVYAPPHHPAGTVHHTKEDALKAH